MEYFKFYETCDARHVQDAFHKLNIPKLAIQIQWSKKGKINPICYDLKGTEVGLREGKQTAVMFAVKWHDIMSFLKKHSGHHLFNTEQMFKCLINARHYGRH